MSLTSHLKDKNSLIRKMFDYRFNNIDLFLKKENEKLKNIPVILPLDEKNYPWSTVGHITEYLLALHMGLPIENLFPMEHMSKLNNTQYQRIKSLNITKENLESKYLSTIISDTLYTLALYETELRTQGNNAVYKTNLYGNPLVLSNVATKDIINIYQQSLKQFPDSNYGYNPSFDLQFSQYIRGADADLIEYKKEGNYLIDVKTTKNNKIEKAWIFQLMGYIALDKEDKHKFKGISIYMPRQNQMLEYNIEEILQNYTELKTIKELRNDFGFALVTQTFPQLMEEKNIIRFNMK